MDSLTQAVLGASITGATLSRFHGTKIVIAGAVLASLPDLDVLIRYSDPILAMTHHRGFSHSLFVLSAFALALTMLWRIMRPDPRYSAAYLFFALWLCLVTHPLLDAFTSYGTQLFWPLSTTPTSWASLFIIDPAYTLPLLIATVIGLFAGTKAITTKASTWALILSTAYICLSLIAQQLADSTARNQITVEGYTPVSSFTTPQPFSILLWRSIVRTTQEQDCEVIVGLFDKGPSESWCAANNHHLAQAIEPAYELDRLRWFSNDWVRFDVLDDLLVVSDLRMGVGPGHYSFRFVVGELNNDNSWEKIRPYFWPSTRDFAILKPVMHRIWYQNPPLPLGTWANEAKLKTQPFSLEPQ